MKIIILMSVVLMISVTALADQTTKVVCSVNEFILQGKNVAKRNTYTLEAPTPDHPRQAQIVADSKMVPGFHVEVIACSGCASVKPPGSATWIRKPQIAIEITNASAESNALAMDTYEDGSLKVGDNGLNIGCSLKTNP